MADFSSSGRPVAVSGNASWNSPAPPQLELLPETIGDGTTYVALLLLFDDWLEPTEKQFLVLPVVAT